MQNRLLAATLVLALLSGCTDKSKKATPALPVGTGEITLAARDIDMPIAGLDAASITYCVRRDQLVCVIWHDSPTASRDSGVEHTEGIVRYDGSYDSTNGKPIVWKCRLGDSNSADGEVTIGGKSYELSDGSLFLLSTATGELRVKQLKRNTLTMKPEPNAFQKLADTDSEIRTFYRAE